MHLTPELMAVMLRAALEQLMDVTSNTNFYNDRLNTDYPFTETMAALDAQYPEVKNEPPLHVHT